MSFENFPYSNFHELNLDWILKELKEKYSAENPPDYPVKSVNGQTGDVIIAIPSNFVHSVNGETGDVVLYRNPLTQFPATDETRWNLFRICDGTETGIEFDENSASRIEGIRRIKIYDEDNPPDYPVTSVNGQTGDVQVTAGVQSVNGKTGAVVTPFVNPNVDILTLDSNSPSILWGISRNVAGGNVALYITTGGANPQAFIRYTPTDGEAINLPLLTNADIPSSAGVVSVNGKTGAVTLYGSDILTTENRNTIAHDIDNLKSTLNQVYIPSENLYNSETDRHGITIDGTGAISENASYKASDYIYVGSGGKVTIDAINGIERFFYYTTNDASGFSRALWRTEEGAKTLQLRSTEQYIVILMLEECPDYMVNLGDTLLPYTPYGGSAGTFLQSAIDNINNTINTLQSTDATHNQQISALQNADATHTQQISALQNANATHNQQISALQSTDATHNQQIAELQTKIGTGIKEVKFTDVVSLPIRYPETGTDTDIIENMACVNAVLSRPGVQRTNLTIIFYNGYLTISGTIQGTTDITLYLAKT